MKSQDIRIYKIYYDSDSKASIKLPYLALDNVDGPEDWYELWPIMRFLESTPLEPNVWYGFVSPKFPEKAHLTRDEVERLIHKNPGADVALFTYNWPALALYKNPWIRDENIHPSLTRCTRDFLKTLDHEVDFNEVTTDFATSVYSNYIIAKAPYWEAWLKIARAYYDYVEAGGPALLDNQSTKHRGEERYKLKTFVQERLASWVLLKNNFKAVYPRYLIDLPMSDLTSGPESKMLRALMIVCEISKQLHRRTGFNGFMLPFRVARKLAFRKLKDIKPPPVTDLA